MIEAGLPAVAFRPVPVVVAAFADQPHLQAGNGFFVTGSVAVNNVKRSLAIFFNDRLVDGGIGAVVINRLAGELRADPRQLWGGPDSLADPTGYRATAGLQQAGLKDHLQRRMRFLPLAGGGHCPTPFVIQRQAHFIQATGGIVLRNIAKLEARQRRNRIAQRAQEQFPLQTVTAGGGAVQIVAGNGEIDVVSGGQRRRLWRQAQRHALGHKVFDVEIPLAQLVVAGIGADVPHAGRRATIQRPGQLIQTVLRLAHHAANHLAVGFHHFQLHRLVG